MNIEHHTYELIEEYLTGNMPEGHPFAKQVASDAELAQEVEVQRLLNEAVIDHRLHKVREIVQQKAAEQRAKQAHRTKPGATFLLGATVLVLVASWMYIYQFAPQEPEKKPIVRTAVPKNSPHVDLAKTTKPTDKKAAPVTAAHVVASLPAKPVFAADVAPVAAAPAIQSAVASPIQQAEVSSTPRQTERIALPSAKSTTVPCPNTWPKLQVHMTKTCKGKEEGTLLLKAAADATRKYFFALGKNENHRTNGYFDKLLAGKYLVWIKDETGCSQLLDTVLVEEKSCPVWLETVFNPQTETWTLPNKADVAGKCTLFDKNGNTVWLRTFIPSETVQWDGTSTGGAILLPGIYPYQIHYQDNTIEQGRVTIAF